MHLLHSLPQVLGVGFVQTVLGLCENGLRLMPPSLGVTRVRLFQRCLHGLLGQFLSPDRLGPPLGVLPL
jgi:hypothetical protein